MLKFPKIKKGDGNIQVSNDAPVAFIGSSSGSTQDGKEYYRLTVADDKGDTFRSYCDLEVWQKVQNMAMGTKVQLVMNVFQGQRGISARITDIVS